MARVRFRARFWVILCILIIGIALGIYFLIFYGKQGELQLGAMRLNYEAKSVIIRDEVSCTTEKYDKIIFDVAEGAAVEQGTQIAQVFRWGYQDSTMQSLLDVRREIMEYQSTLLAGIVNPELDATNLQIDQKLQAIRIAARDGGETDILRLEQELKALLNKRMEQMRDIQPDETLTALYKREEEQQQNLASWKRDIVNDVGSGIVSFYFDGYEPVLNAAKLDLISADLVASALKGAAGNGNSMSTSSESPLYRLIDSDHFYIAFLTDATNPFRVSAGEQYTVLFDGYEQQAFLGKAHEPIVSDKQIVNILEFEQDLGTLIGIRTAQATIMLDASGFSVPLDAVMIEDGIPGIQILSGDNAVFTPVDVLATDENHAIIRAKGGTSLMEGLRYQRG